MVTKRLEYYMKVKNFSNLKYPQIAKFKYSSYTIITKSAIVTSIAVPSKKIKN